MYAVLPRGKALTIYVRTQLATTREGVNRYMYSRSRHLPYITAGVFKESALITRRWVFID